MPFQYTCRRNHAAVVIGKTPYMWRCAAFGIYMPALTRRMGETLMIDGAYAATAVSLLCPRRFV
jgi:hypothetical protein